MKTKQTKIHRSGAKWLPGAMALAATTASSQAATVQITLTGNKISSTSAGGNSLDADLTGDGTDDLVFRSMIINDVRAKVAFGIGGIAYASRASGRFYAKAGITPGGVGRFGSVSGLTPRDTSYLNAISFTDSRVNGGAATNGWLESHAFNSSATSHTVEFTRLIFDDASVTRPAFASIPGAQTEWSPTVIPEPSSFALLGLGAAGLLARRRRQAA
jgi:hypothetical protein